VVLAVNPQFAFARLPLSGEELTQATIVGTIALLMMSAPMLLGARWATREAAVPYKSGVLSPFALTSAGVLIFALQAFILHRAFGGWGAALSQLSQRSIIGGLGYATNLDLLAVPLIITAWIESGRRRKRGLQFFCTAILLAALPWLAIVKGRGMVLIVLLTGAVAYYRICQLRPRLIITIVGAVTAIGSIVVGLAWRVSAQSGRPFVENLGRVSRNALEVTSSTAPLVDHYAAGIQYARLVGHDYGASLLTALTVLVPRALWADKPRYLPQLLGEALYRNPTSGMPAGLLGEGHLAFGLFGPWVFALVFGAIILLMERIIRRPQRALLKTWLLYVMVSFVLGTLRTGPQAGLMLVQVSALIGLPLFVAEYSAAILLRRLHDRARGARAGWSAAAGGHAEL